MESPQSSTPPESAENFDRTQPVPSPPVTSSATRPPVADEERTQAVPPPNASTPQRPSDPTPSQEEIDRQLARELARRGVPADEIDRLVAMGRGEPVLPAPKAKAAVIITPPPIPPSEAYEPQPTITLPEFRESTVEDTTKADRLLSSANVARRRGNFPEAEKLCREAIDLVPKDAAALEMFGDILQAVGQVDNALYSYDRAKTADPNRRSAERKYAELMLLQNHEIDLLRQEYIPRNPNVAVLLSAVVPGGGQIYNGDLLKGIITAALFALSIFVIFYTPLGLPHTREGVPTSLVLFILLACVVYIYAVVDANLSARRGKRQKTGWEV